MKKKVRKIKERTNERKDSTLRELKFLTADMIKFVNQLFNSIFCSHFLIFPKKCLRFYIKRLQKKFQISFFMI